MKRLSVHLLSLFSLMFVLNLFSCKDPGEEPENIPLVFSSIEAGRDTIFTEDTTRLRATATGNKLSYHWYVEKGDLLGSGAEIIFLATPCTVGNNTVFCTVQDGYQKEITKQVVITVF